MDVNVPLFSCNAPTGCRRRRMSAAATRKAIPGMNPGIIMSGRAAILHKNGIENEKHYQQIRLYNFRDSVYCPSYLHP